MWLRFVLVLFIQFNYLTSVEYNFKNEPLDIMDIFLENLKEDPFLKENQLSSSSKTFIDTKLKKIYSLILQEQNAVYSRKKRSIKDDNVTQFSIRIALHEQIPTKDSDDVRVFEHNSYKLAASLQQKNELVFFGYREGGGDGIDSLSTYNIKYSTNLGILSLDDYAVLVVVGDDTEIEILRYTPRNNKIKKIQYLRIENAKHIHIWLQDHIPYLSVVHTPNSTKAIGKKSVVSIYKWLGRHFDLIQNIELYNINKITQFSIHGSSFLVAVKRRPNEDDIKSFSDVFKYDIHEKKFKIYQRLLTECCMDIKYFNIKIHNEENHFLITTSTSCADHKNLKNITKSVIYKYVDQYFIPFQSIDSEVTEWQPFKDTQGHAALIGVSPKGLKGFQYDGWQFFIDEITINESLSRQLNDIKKLHVFSRGTHQFLVTVCDHCENTSYIYSVSFNHSNPMRELHKDMLTWCKDQLNEIQSRGESEFVAESLRGDLTERISPVQEDTHRFASALNELQNDINNLQTSLSESYRNKEFILEEDISADTIIFNNSTFIDSLKTIYLNNITVDSLLDNVLNIEDGFNTEEDLLMEFDFVNLQNPVHPETMNDIRLKDYIDITKDLSVKNMIINESVVFKKGVNISDTINDISVDNNTILLNNDDQIFLYDLNLTDIEVLNITTKFLNGLNLNISSNHDVIRQIDTLMVKDLEIHGYLNNVSIPVLYRKALKKFGTDQELSEDLSVDFLNVENLAVGGKISEKDILKDFVLINGEKYAVDQNVYFEEGLTVNQLEVLNSLQNITLLKETGELDILLKNSSNVQLVTSKKTFEMLSLLNPMTLRHKIRNKRIQDMNPVSLDDRPYEIEGDVIVEGQVDVKKWLKVENIEEKQGMDLKNVLNNGAKLTDTSIAPYLTFNYSLDMIDTYADKINGFDPHNWLLKKSDSSQTITGKKIFLNDVNITGNVDALKINDVDVQALQKEYLNVNFDQDIEGIWNVEYLEAEGLKSTNTYFGSKLWNETTLFKQNQNFQKTKVLNGSYSLNFTKARNIELHGLLNSLKISEVVKNLVKKDTKFNIHGQKFFKEIHVGELNINNDTSDLKRFFESVNKGIFTVEDNLELFENTSVKNVNFIQTLNNLTVKDFENVMNNNINKVEDFIAPKDGRYNEIVVLGDVYIVDNKISGKFLDSIANDTVKTDEDHHFQNAEIDESVLVEDTLFLEGDIENLDLNNMVIQNFDKPLEISDKTFYKNIVVNGSLNLENTLNGVDLEKYCRFNEDSQLKSLKIEGNAIFAKGPILQQFNDISLNSLLENVWFSDKSVNITGTVRLHNATFKKELYVKEYIDGINLKLLSQNYLSKTKVQTISSNLSFENVTFLNITASRMETDGPVNGVNIDQLLKTILLQNVTQTFDSLVYFEDILVTDLEQNSPYLVNDLDLTRDVMMYDRNNIVTGEKKINNLIVDNLKISNDSYVQNVKILDWLENAILKNGSLRVPAKKVFNRATFQKNLSLRGVLNDNQFNENTVMLFDRPQNIKGKKVFSPPTKEGVRFKNLKIKGLVNDVDLEDLVNNHANKNKNNKINSRVTFNNNITVENINVDVMYDNVNVTELLSNISQFGALEKFRENFGNLLETGIQIENSVRNQNGFFKYFKEIMHLNTVDRVFGIRCMDEVLRLVIFSFVNGTNYMKIYEWDNKKTEFFEKVVLIESYDNPSFIEHVSLNGIDYLYIEFDSIADEQLGNGKLIQFWNATTVTIAATFNKNTYSLISFKLPKTKQPCLGFISKDLIGMEILCDENGYHGYYLYKKLNYPGVYKATSIETENSLFLILARHKLQTTDPSIVVLESSRENDDFVETQTIFEGAETNSLATAIIDGVPFVAFSIISNEGTVNVGRISVKRLDIASRQFREWQHIPLTSPLDVHFIGGVSFEPLLLASSGDSNIPCPTYRYEGLGGFKMILRGAALPTNSVLRVSSNENIVFVIEPQKRAVTILGAIVKGNARV